MPKLRARMWWSPTRLRDPRPLLFAGADVVVGQHLSGGQHTSVDGDVSDGTVEAHPSYVWIRRRSIRKVPRDRRGHGQCTINVAANVASVIAGYAVIPLAIISARRRRIIVAIN